MKGTHVAKNFHIHDHVSFNESRHEMIHPRADMMDPQHHHEHRGESLMHVYDHREERDILRHKH
jgi:hypothetical protein